MTDDTEIREFVKEQQVFDKEQMNILRQQRANKRDAQRAEREHELAMEQLRHAEAARIRDHQLAMRQVD